MARPEKPLDPGTGPVAQFADGLRCLRREARLSYRALAQRSSYSPATLSQAAAGEKLPSLAVTLAYVQACGAGTDLAGWEARWHQAEQAVRRALASVRTGTEADAPAPYRGLARYEPTDSALFFGRSRLTDQLLALVGRERVSVVIGPSGSGKSSLLRAGLLPRLQHPGPTDTSGLRPAGLRICTPGSRPVSRHGALFVPRESEAAGAAERTGDDTVLVIDQFEEVFTLCSDVDEREAFVGLVLAARERGSRLRVVLGVRADFYSHCLRHPGLTEVLREAALPVGPMSTDELRQAITKPAVAHGLVVERALTARLVADVSAEPGGLPLMSHALLETWRHRTGRTLTLEAYEATGALDGAVAKTAETLYASLDDRQALLVRRVLLRLITPGDGAPDTRRPTPRSELDFGHPEEISAVLEQLVRARLITLDDGHIDLAHETLIRAWPRLNSWIAQDRERLQLHRQLSDAARTWQQLGRTTSELWRGARLDAARAVFAPPSRQADLTPAESAFLHAALRERRHATLRTRAQAVAVGLLVGLTLLASALALRHHPADRNERLRTTARELAHTADSLRPSDPALSARLGLAAWSIADLPETRAALLAIGAPPTRLTTPFTPAARAAELCGRDGVALTREEWQQYIPSAPYQPPCPGAAGRGPTPDP
ncbi:helix-turn-helix domain-containing protein [Streptomyces crystallinus]|uniref:Novel STAND NTPase 1 domain-containing protein n=1 Tax=Streptomyces crystallinus TaxID=68191 RepID=A0ABN1FL85_9ACTN